LSYDTANGMTRWPLGSWPRQVVAR